MDNTHINRRVSQHSHESCTHNTMLPKQRSSCPASWMRLVVSCCGRGQNYLIHDQTRCSASDRRGALCPQRQPSSIFIQPGWNLINVGSVESIVSHGKSGGLSSITMPQLCERGETVYHDSSVWAGISMWTCLQSEQGVHFHIFSHSYSCRNDVNWHYSISAELHSRKSTHIRNKGFTVLSNNDNTTVVPEASVGLLLPSEQEVCHLIWLTHELFHYLYLRLSRAELCYLCKHCCKHKFDSCCPVCQRHCAIFHFVQLLVQPDPLCSIGWLRLADTFIQKKT